jgi:hypothetical protein
MRTPISRGAHPRVRVLFAALALALAASAPVASFAKGRPALREGTILVVRGAHSPEPQFTDEDGKRWLVVGSLREELLQTDGHKVKVMAGEAGTKETIPALEVSSYEIVDCGGGRRPYVGTLLKHGDDLRLAVAKGKPMLVEASPALARRLERHLGCKVWLAGDLAESTLKTFKYGWLKCPAPSKPPTQPGKERRP